MSHRFANGMSQALSTRNIPESWSNCKVFTLGFCRHAKVPGRWYVWRYITLFFALWFWLNWQAPIASLTQSPPPEFDAGSYHLYLIPGKNYQGLDFLTHIVEIHVSQDDQSSTLFDTVASYRWHNTKTEPLKLELFVRSRTGTIINPTNGQLQQFGLYREEETVPLTPLDNGQYYTPIHLDPGQRLTLDLRYTVRSPVHYFPRVAYDSALLRRWLNVPDSMRLSIFPGFAPQAGNVLIPAPVNYELRQDEVRWLFEENLPSQTLEAHFLHKDVWESIQLAIQKNDQITLGQHFHALYMAVDAPESHRRIFYDQALAAFLQALAQDPGQAHYGLARLYRIHSLSGTGDLNAQYLELALHHSQMALQTLDPEASAQRQDVIRWLWQSLEQRVNWAVQHADWETVKTSLEAIEALPDQEFNTVRLDNIRRHAHTQQAIRLLEQGETDQALALAGPEILDPHFMPADHLIPLFTGWTADISIGPEAFTAHLAGTIDVRHHDRIAQAVEDLENLLSQGESGVQTTLALGNTPSAEDSPAVPVLILNLSVTNPHHARNLAGLLPANSEWVLLRHLLQGSWLYMSQTRNPIFIERVYEYTLNLDELFRLWHTKAMALEETAIAEASAGTNSQEEVIRQMNFLNAANDWRHLARNTMVMVSLETGRAATTAGAQWAATEDQPSVKIRAATRQLRLLNLVLFGLLGLFLAGSFSLVLVRLPGQILRSSQRPSGP